MFAQLAQYHMDYGGHMHDGWGWGMAVVMLLVLLAAVALVVWVVRSTGASHAQAHAGPARETAMEILDRRLASGEITPEEHTERAALLKRS